MGSWPFPLVRPMLATLGELPEPPGWAYEFKWDGVRAIAYVDAGRVHLASRNDRDITAGYPELTALGKRFPRRRAILDGEIVALDAAGRPSFSLLQQRMHVRAPSAGLRERVPVQLYLFDLLHLGPTSLLDKPFTARRARLDGLGIDEDSLKIPPYWTDGEGPDLLNAAAEIGLEGVVAKRLDSTYQPGLRSRQWVKTPLNKTVEVIIGGWAPGEGRRSGTIGSLILGMYDETGQFRFVGNVGTGFTQQALADLKRQLEPLHRPTPPFAPPVPREHVRHATWVEPQLVGEVAYRTLTPERRMRHPAWRGLRPDRQPEEVTTSALR
jgi:bifunctional non-homologous end joining protein LigD